MWLKLKVGVDIDGLRAVRLVSVSEAQRQDSCSLASRSLAVALMSAVALLVTVSCWMSKISWSQLSSA